MLLKYYLFLILAIPQMALANLPSLKTDYSEKKNFIGISYENSSFATELGDLKGSGVRVNINNRLFDNLYSELFLSVALNNQSSVQSSFTGLGGYVLYNLFGKCTDFSKKTLINNEIVFEEHTVATQCLLLGAGLNQYFLNGTKGVYSTSGLGAEAVYKFQIYGLDLKLAARYSMLSASQTEVKATSFDFGFLIPF